jgi:predicted PhzF superfamily epimerase YddE/YHI9
VPELHVVRVFTGDDGAGGNPLGVFLAPDLPPDDAWQAVAADLGFSETVFASDPATGRLRIFTPAAELPLAGHPLVGTSWLLHELGRGVDTLQPPAGAVPTWRDGDWTWIRARAEWAPPFEIRQLGSAAEVDAADATDMPENAETELWAWADEEGGVVRARVFPRALGILEDEATGAAALRLCDTLGRAIDIRQGEGSRVLARPGPGGTVEVGGRVAAVERRAYEPAAA